MRFQPPGEETIREMARLGLWPRASDFGRVRVVGVYDMPYFEDFTVVEVLENRPAWMISLEDWWPYTPPGWDEEWGVGRPDFYLSEDGEELIGSYLHQPPIGHITRFAIVLRQHEWPLLLDRAGVPVPKTVPIPDRLLRLIWIDG